MRYLLGALNSFEESERLPLDQMPPLERFILHRLWELDGEVRQAYEEYRFQDVVRPVLEFCSGDLSALYFDIRKDSLYCDRPDAIRRRAARTVMDEVFMRLTAWLAPLTPFTMEEAWTTRFPEAGSNCARIIPETPADWRNDAEAARWKVIFDIREIVTGELELARREKKIGSSLDAEVTLYVGRTPGGDNEEYKTIARESGKSLWSDFEGLDPAEIFITSQAFLSDDPPPAGTHFASPHFMISAAVRPSELPKCARSWRRVPDVGSDPDYPELSARDADAVRWWDAQNAKAS